MRGIKTGETVLSAIRNESHVKEVYGVEMIAVKEDCQQTFSTAGIGLLKKQVHYQI